MQSLSSIDAWKCSFNLSAEGLCPSYQSSSCKSKSWRVFKSIQTFSYHVRILSCILSSFDISLDIHPIQDCVDIHYIRNNGKDTFLWSVVMIHCTDGINLTLIEVITPSRIVKDGFFVWYMILLLFIVWKSRLRKKSFSWWCDTISTIYFSNHNNVWTTSLSHSFAK